MALAVTVFGVSSEKLTPTLCHVLLRMVRGAGQYPPPTLPKDTSRTPAISKLTIEGTPLELLAWDAVVPDVDENAIVAGVDAGQFTIPTACPIAGGVQLPGVAFGPIIVEEDAQRVSVSGRGLLYWKGLALDGPLHALKTSLSDVLPPGTMPVALRAIVQQIAAFSGMEEVLKARRAVGTVDYFYRAFPPALIEGPFFDVVADKSDMRKPMLKVHIRRHAAPVDQFFRLTIQLKNHDDILSVKTIDIANGVSEVVADAPAHITDVSLSVFDDKGSLVDFLDGKFPQSMDFGLSVISGSDVLPPAFAGAPHSPDLEKRPRITTTTFGRPAATSLSGGLGVLRKTDQLLENVIGKADAVPEDVWFERDAKGQLEVIRWIKGKVETPATAKAFLVDPYLGSDALKRVIVRQGNESIDLKILISPGNIDPDADDVAATSGYRFLDTLIETATAWAAKLAGRIEIVHIKRGSGNRQAFHDRYLCIVDRSGIPTVYLLSNSLSKAAGDWPFAISKLDRVTAWRVYSYIQEMLAGRVAGTVPEILWQRDGSESDVPAATPPPSQADQEPGWVAPAKALLANVYTAIIRNANFKESLTALFDAFLTHPPEGIDFARFARGLYDVVDHRDKIVVFTIDYFRQHDRADVADVLEAKFVENTLLLVPKPGQKTNWHINFEERALILKALGVAIAHKTDATTFVRDELNPRVHKLVLAVETQRLGNTLPFEAQEAALFLSIAAFEAAARSDAPVKFRVGLTTDYIHWVGRLARSDQSWLYDESGIVEYRRDIELAGMQIVRARLALGAELDVPIQRVLDDPLVARTLKTILSSVPPT